MKCPCTWDHEYPSMHGLSSIVASRSRYKLKNLEFKTNGGSLTWYAPTATLTPYFNTLHQPKTPVFTQICHPKSYFFHTVQNFGIFFLKDPKSTRILEKGTQMLSIFVAFVTESPPIFCLACTCLKGNVAPSNTVRSWKILYSWNRIMQLGNTFRCKFNKGDENKISLNYRLNRPNCALSINVIGGQGWLHRPSPPWSNTEGIYPTTILYMIRHESWLSKQM